jgi:plasmid stabilization system protein ParE
MSQVVWLPEAVEDIIRLRGFLEDKSPEAANRAGAVIRSGAKMLADFPAIGKPMNDSTGRREYSCRLEQEITFYATSSGSR